MYACKVRSSEQEAITEGMLRVCCGDEQDVAESSLHRCCDGAGKNLTAGVKQ